MQSGQTALRLHIWLPFICWKTKVRGVPKELEAFNTKGSSSDPEGFQDLSKQEVPTRRRLKFVSRWAKLQLNKLARKRRQREKSSRPDIHAHLPFPERQRHIINYFLAAACPCVMQAQAIVDACGEVPNIKVEQKVPLGEFRTVTVQHVKTVVNFVSSQWVADAIRRVNEYSARQWKHGDCRDRDDLQCWHEVSLPTMSRLEGLMLSIDVAKKSKVFSLQHFRGNRTSGKGQLVRVISAWCSEFLTKEPSVRETSEGMTDLNTQISWSQRASEEETSSSSATEMPPEGAEDELSELSDEEHQASDSGFVRTHLVARTISFMSDVVDVVTETVHKELHHGVHTKWEFKRGKGPHTWSDVDATAVPVRGPAYFSSGGKGPSLAALCETVCVDLIKVQSEIKHMSQQPGGVVQLLRKDGEERFLFVLNWRLPPVQVVCVFALPREAPDADAEHALALFERFKNMEDAERNKRFKVIPSVREGPWLVKRSLGRPTIMGKALAIDYFHQPGSHFEVSIDVFSSSTARSIVGMVQSAASKVVLEVSTLFECQDAAELPERIFGGFCLNRCDLSKCRGPLAPT
uniref:Protein ENHANCED DISEASE RESISTANCE 2 C-terminal domain-containing protein n=1 Tax=Noctiluca scintillans TaxID=2966 RepID=A0A7S1A015_NOCSC